MGPAAVRYVPPAQRQVEADWRAFTTRRCDRARDRIIESHRHLLEKTLGRMLPNMPAGVDQDDICQEGALGLVKAVDAFDPEKKVQPRSYIITRIRGAMLDYLRKCDVIPRRIREKLRKLEVAQDACREDADRAAYLGMALDEYYELCAATQIPVYVSLDLPHHNEGDADQLRIEDVLRSDEPCGYSVALRRARQEALYSAMDRLPRVERTILWLHYRRGLTVEEIADKAGMGKCRTHQLHHQGLGRMRQALTLDRSLFMDDDAAAEYLPGGHA